MSKTCCDQLSQTAHVSATFVLEVNDCLLFAPCCFHPGARKCQPGPFDGGFCSWLAGIVLAVCVLLFVPFRNPLHNYLNGQCLQSHWSDIERSEAITETLGENFTASLEGFCVHIST